MYKLILGIEYIKIGHSVNVSNKTMVTIVDQLSQAYNKYLTREIFISMFKTTFSAISL